MLTGLVAGLPLLLFGMAVRPMNRLRGKRPTEPQQLSARASHHLGLATGID